MRQTILLGLFAASISVSVSNTALAGIDDYEDRGRVISASPQFERINSPRQQCHTEYVRETYYEQPQRSYSGAIIGGVAGGLLGNTVGRGSGRVAAAAVGAGVGAIVGDRYDNGRDNYRGRERVESRPVERCVNVDNWNQVPAGYLVNYEYNGRQYTTVTQSDPGRYIPVQVAIRSNGYVSTVSYDNRRFDDRDNDRYDDDDHREHKGHGKGHYKNKHKHHNRQYW